MKITFVITNNLLRFDGHTIRLKEIINSLAKRENSISLIMNNGDSSIIDPSVTIYKINYTFGKTKKRMIHFLVAYKCKFLISILYRTYLNQLISLILKDQSDLYIFPESLDNSIGYYVSTFLPSCNICIDNFGIISDEFKNRGGYNLFQKLIFYIKHKVAIKYEQTIFEYPKNIIFTSNSMRLYFQNKYTSIKYKKSFIVPDSYLPDLINMKKKSTEFSKITNSLNDSFIFLFAGEFKQISGVDDLLSAFFRVCTKIENAKLLLIGDGVLDTTISNHIKTSKHCSSVIKINRVSFDDLQVFMKLSHVLVSPEKKNLLSDLVLHIKYYNYLTFNKPIICSRSDAVKKFNKDDKYSISFDPGSISDLANKILYSYDNFEILRHKYSSSSDSLNNLSYAHNTMAIDC